MGCISKACKTIFLAIASLCKVGVTIAIIIIVALHLLDVELNVVLAGDPVTYKANCLMNGSLDSESLCDYTFAVCGISLAVSFVASFFLCLTCDACGCGAWIELIIYSCQVAWWIVASIIISKNAQDANERGVPQENWRNAVAILSWIVAFFCFTMALAALVDACKCLRDCCCIGGSDDKRKANAV